MVKKIQYMAVLLAFFACAINVQAAEEKGQPAELFALPPEGALGQIRYSDFTASPTFTSPLPILVIEPTEQGGQPSPTTRLTLYAGDQGRNSLQDAPSAVLDVAMRAATDHLPMEKGSYSIELPAPDPVSLAGLPPDREWLLRGSSRDKCMLRNGLAYELGRLVFPELTPETRFCEVLLRQGGTYRYEGIYILSEGMARISAAVARDGAQALYLRPGPGLERRGERVVRVGNKIFATLRPGRGGLVVQPVTEDKRRETAVELEKLESLLYSVHPVTFLRYQQTLDESTAIDLFILNGIMLNALERSAPFALFRNVKGKIQYMPEWRFDDALDNMRERSDPLPFEQDPQEIAPPSVLARKVPVWRVLEAGGDITDLRMNVVYSGLSGENFLWFDRLFLSRSFITGLYSRYHELRREGLAPDRIATLVDNLVFRLGPAIERDWARWYDEYSGTGGGNALEPYIDEDGEEFIRQTVSYEQELVKITHCLREQDAYLLSQIQHLDWMTADLYDKSTSGTRQAAYAFLILIFMFILTHLLTRRL